MLLVFEALGILTTPGKTFGPSQIFEFLGVELDSSLMEARWPQDKVEKVRVKCVVGQKSVTLQELQSLIGLLNFACKVVPPGRPFLQRMIQLTRGGGGGGKTTSPPYQVEHRFS